MRTRLAVAVLLGIAMVLGAQADFNAATGFSGRFGFDCTSCHPSAPVPSQEPVRLVVEGGPVSWTYGDEVELTIRIEGGPPAMPAPQPQGGFEADTDTGRMAVAPGMEDLTRTFGETGITYTVEGTMVREWRVLWQAPNATVPPTPASIWVAAMAANGNHVIAAGAGDGGEHGDAVQTGVIDIPASDEAWQTWLERLLAPPTVDQAAFTVSTGQEFTVAGHHQDVWADSVQWAWDGGEPQRRTTGPEWRLQLTPPSAGTHTLSIWSAEGVVTPTGEELGVRFSPPLDLQVEVEGGGFQAIPMTPVWLTAAFLAIAGLARRR